MINENPFGYVANIIGLISAIVNILLIYLSVKVKNYSTDIKLILSIASIELMLPLVAISDPILSIIKDDDAFNDPAICQYLGFFTMLLALSQLIVSTFLALERLAKVCKLDYRKYYFLVGILSILIHLTLTIILAYQHHFIIQPAKVICMIYPNQSILSAITFYHFIISTLVSLIIITTCYIKLALYTSQLTQFIEMENSSDFSLPKDKIQRPWSQKLVQLKIHGILISYSISVFLGACFVLLDACFFYEKKDLKLNYIFGTAGVIFIAFGFLFNSLLVISTHSIINNQLKELFKRIFRRRR
ncbi:hypothetical protein K502DRAFT_218378 [Neoconidiobolus thromboides FSU 785]|nr:hypothetical protein K502DRAFT_218378 [Neoconidiobolus thromboides FSU 785]